MASRAHREERSERDREESTWAEGVGTRGEREGETAEKTGFLADRATNRRPETQVTHPDSTNNQTPSILRPFYHPVQLRSATLLFFVALPPSPPSRIFCFCTAREAPRRLEDSDKRGQLTGVFGMHGAEHDASWSKGKEREG